MIASIINQKGGFQSGEVRYAHAPERVLPGRILKEVVENDRIIGGLDSASTEAAAAFYRTFVTGQLLLCSARMAELAKLTENASRDVQIAFANELSMICHDLDLDVLELISLANRHPRVKILQPGCGVGGHAGWVRAGARVAPLGSTLIVSHRSRERGALRHRAPAGWGGAAQAWRMGAWRGAQAIATKQIAVSAGGCCARG